MAFQFEDDEAPRRWLGFGFACVVVAGLAGVGAGLTSQPPSAEAYRAGVVALCERSVETVAADREGGARVGPAGGFGRFAGDRITALSRLTPPPEQADEHQRLLAGEQRLVEASANYAAGAASMRPDRALDAGFQIISAGVALEDRYRAGFGVARCVISPGVRADFERLKRRTDSRRHSG